MVLMILVQWVCFLLNLEGMVHTGGSGLADTGLLIAAKWLPRLVVALESNGCR